MNALAQIDGQRALTVAAFDALISLTLAGPTVVARHNTTSFAARHLLERLQASGMADVTSTADSLTMQLFGIRATAHGGTAISILRAWQSAARDTLAQGVRR